MMPGTVVMYARKNKIGPKKHLRLGVVVDCTPEVITVAEPRLNPNRDGKKPGPTIVQQVSLELWETPIARVDADNVHWESLIGERLHQLRVEHWRHPHVRR